LKVFKSGVHNLVALRAIFTLYLRHEGPTGEYDNLLYIYDNLLKTITSYLRIFNRLTYLNKCLGLFMFVFTPEDGDSMFLRNAGIYLQVHTALQPRRPTRTSSSQWGSQNSYCGLLIYINNSLQTESLISGATILLYKMIQITREEMYAQRKNYGVSARIRSLTFVNRRWGFPTQSLPCAKRM
jgi:hypothetical protein